MKKKLFIHNAIPEYRVEFLKKLESFMNYDLIVTNHGLESSIYRFDNDLKGINYCYYDEVDIKSIIDDYDGVILPPIDSLKEFIIATKVQKLCKRKCIETYYWCEKWEADREQQPLKKKIKNLIQRKLIYSIVRKTERCIAAGTKSKEYLIKMGVDEGKVFVAIDSSTSPMPKTLIDIRRKYCIPNDKKVILFLGRVVYRKGCGVLISAVKDILEDMNAVLLICGDGEDMTRCRKLAENNDSIIFCGMIQPEQRKSYYQQSDLFVIPSVCDRGVVEAWGLTVNEALECGTPVITTNIVGAAYDLISEDNGSIVKQNDPLELQEAIKKILSSESVYNRTNIQIAYDTMFSVDKMAENFGKVISK